ncbi:MAG: filamentous hemagglutinin N-terminal domain-containing protein [Acidisphaera sp.]|nr:filamentous hemagglutinin N-terminal domain-containing protein [Acidisphaera sp.]
MGKRRSRPACLQGGVRLLGVLRRDRASLLRTTALQTAVLSVVALPVAAQPAPNAQPMGGQVVAGAASIAQAARTTTINQSSQRAAIDWKSFDVGSQQAVDFNQPSSSAITLNRVTGPDPSAIAGQIHANGQLVLTNQSGVVFYRGAQVDAQSLVVSAPGITTKNFMAGRMVFDQPAKPGAMVANAGVITVKQAGLAALVAPEVANSGVINARMGHVVLAGAEAHTVDLYGDGLMAIDVTKQVTQVPRGPDGKPVAALVTNSGLIRADGGTVQLTAKAADGIVQNLVDAGGRIEAASVGTKAGTIAIDGTGGSIVVTGQIEAVGRAPGSTGGQIELDASKTVNVRSGAVVDASGASGGGVIAIGTTLPRAIGGPGVKPTMTAARTVVARGARIAADSQARGNGGQGNGGQVTLLSSGITNFSGTITARGGKLGGNGGNVEISGPKLGLHGGVDVTATHGAMGNITLDPANLTITNSAANNGDLTDNTNPNLGYNTGGTTTDASVSPAAIEALHGNVRLQTTDNLTVASSVSLTTAGQSLTLEAGDNLQVNALVTISTAGSITLAAASSDIPGFNSAGGLSLIRGASVTTSGGDVNLSAGSAGIKVDDSSVAVSSGHTIALNADKLNVYGFTLALDAPNGVIAVAPATPGLPVELINSGTAASGSLVVSQYEIGLMSAATLRLGSGTAGQITIGSSSTDHISLAGVSSVSGGITTLDLETSAGVTEVGSLNIGALTGNARSLVSMGVLANTITNLAGFGALGGLSLGNTGDITVSGVVTAPNVVAIQTQPNGTLSAGNITIGSTITATDVSLIAGSTSVGAAVSESSTGLLNAGTLTGTADSFTLSSPGNSISDLGSLSAGSSVVVDDGVPLTVIGSVGAGTSFSATGVGITLANGGTLDTPRTTVASTGPFTETGNGALITSTLGGSASSVSLGGTANQVTTLGGFTASTGGFSLTDSTPLTVAGTVSVATGQLLSISDDSIGFGSDSPKRLVATSGTVALSPSSANAPLLVFASGAANATGLSLRASNLASYVTTSTLQLGSATTGNITLGNTGDAITIPGSVANTLALVTDATGVVTEGGPLTVGALTGNAGSVALGNANLVGTLGNFASTNGFSLTNAQSLSVTGTVTGGTGVTLAVSTGGLMVASSISASSVRLTDSDTSASGGSIVQTGGTISASTSLYLSAPKAITQSGGEVIAGTLGIGGDPTVTLTGANNTIGHLAGVLAANLALTDQSGVSITGFVDVGGTASLVSQGTIGEGTTYGLFAGTLTGSAAAVVLPNADNEVATLGDFHSTGGFTLANSGSLTVAGSVSDGVGISLLEHGTLALAGTLGAPSISLVAHNATIFNDFGSLVVPGVISQTAGAISGPTLVTLGADGSIAQSGGSISTGLLEANAPGGVSLTGTANLVADLGSSSSAGGFALADAQSLTVTGPVTDAPGVSLSVIGDLTIANTISGPTVYLGATGAITETSTGIVDATTLLTGSAGASTSLGQVGNSVASIGSFSSGGNFLLSDSVPLTVAGTVSVGTLDTLAIADNSPSFASGGALVAPGGTVALAPLTPNGPVTLASSGGFTGSLAVTANTLQIGSATTGAIDIASPVALAGAGTLDLVGTAISETGTGAISVSTLEGTGTSATLNGANSIANLGSFTTTPGGFSLTNAQSLAVTGTVTGGTGVTLAVSTGNLIVASSITAPTVRLIAGDTAAAGGSIVQTGGTISASTSLYLFAYNAITQTGGGLIAGTLGIGGDPTVTLTGANNTIGHLAGVYAANLALTDQSGVSITGFVDIGGTASLVSKGTIGEGTTYGLFAGTLTGSAAAVVLPNADNEVGTLGDFHSTSGFTLANSGPLTVTGSVGDGVGISLSEFGTLGLAGTLAAPTIGLVAHTETLAAPTFGLIAQARALAAAARYVGVISQTAGAVSGPTLVTLGADGSIVQSGGSISTGLLEANAPGGVSLTGTANLVADLGSSSSAGGFALTDAQSLIVSGPVSDPPGISLSIAGNLTIASSLTAPTVYLGATGAITETSTGIVDATTLTGHGAGVSIGYAVNSVSNIGSFASSGNFLLVDTAPLSVIGTVSAGSLDTLAISDNAPTLAAGGFLSAPGGLIAIAPTTPGTGITLAAGGGLGTSPAVNAATLQIGSSTAGPISIAGAFDLTGASTLDLVSHGAITESGSVAAQVLDGSAASAALNGGNSVATLGSFATAGGFSLTNTVPLLVNGPVNDTGVGVAIFDPGHAITVAGVVSGPTATLSATGTGGAVVQTGGSIATTGALVLDGGSIGQSGGTISAGTLIGSAGQVTLTGSSNLVANLGTFAVATPPGQTYSADFRLDDTRGLTVIGPVTAGGTIALDVTGTGSNLTIANALAAGPLLDLIATGGTISEAAGADASATTLIGRAAAATLTGINDFATLAGFYTSNGLTLTNSAPSLTVAGPVLDTTSVVISEPGTLLVSGTVAAPGVTLDATPTFGTFANEGVIDITGAVVAGATAALNASGSITESGFVDAVTLTGSSGGTTSLASITNAVTDLGGFTSTGAFGLADGTGLAVTGTVSAPSLSVAIGGALTEPSGSLRVTTLTGNASSASLGQIANSISNLGPFTTTGGFALTDGAPVTVAGTVMVGNGQTLTLADDAPSFIGGAPLIAVGGTVVLAPATVGDALALGGGGFGSGSSVIANTLQIGSASTGSITITGSLDLTGANTLDLVSGSTIAETGVGAIAAPVLDGSAAAATLGGGNAVGTLGGFTIASGFSLNDTVPLAVNGPVVSSAGGVSLSDPGQPITVAGLVSAPTVTLSATGVGGAILQTGGTLAASGVLVLDGGSIAQTGGSIVAPLLEGSASGNVALTGTANAIATLGSFSDTGTFGLNDAVGLAVVGPVSAASVGLVAAGTLAISGIIDAPSQTSLSGTVISETSTAGVATGLLTGSATSAALTGANDVGTLGGFTSSGGFTLDSAFGLVVRGPVADLTAIAIDEAGPLTLAGTIGAPVVSLAATNTGSLPGTISQTAGAVTAGQLTLAAAGGIGQSGGSIVAGTLTGDSGTTASLTQTSNAIADLASFHSGGDLSIADGTALAITGPVGAGALGLTIAGALTEPSGSIAAVTLTGSAASAALGLIANSIGNLGSFTTTGDFALTDGTPLTVAGMVTVGTGHTLTIADDAPSFAAGGSLVASGGTVALAPATAGDALILGGGSGFGSGSRVTANTLQIGSASTGSISITGALDLTGANTLDLVSGAAIAETGAGAIAAPVLTGQASAATLTGGNAIGALGSFATTAGFSLTNAQSLTVSGPVSDANSGVRLELTGGSLTLAGSVAGPSVTLFALGGGIAQQSGAVSASNVLYMNAAGAITQAGSAGLTAGTLEVVQTGGAGVSLTGGGNTIANLATIDTPPGGFSLVDQSGVNISGFVGDPSSNLTLNVGGSLSINSSLLGNQVDLIAAGDITAPTGGLRATTLTGSARSLTVTGPFNYVGTLGDFVTNSGFTLTNRSISPVVSGTLRDGAGITLTARGTLGVSGTLSAPSVSLAAATYTGTFGSVAGVISQTAGLIDGGTAVSLTAGSEIVQSGGSLITGTLSGSSGGPALLAEPTNAIGTLGGFTAAGQLTLADGQALAIGGTVSAPAATLLVSGALSEPAGAISTGLLSGTASSASLRLIGNSIASLGGFVTSGDFALADGSGVAIAGSVSVGTGHTLTLADDAPSFGASGSLIAPGGTVVLAPATVGDALSLGGGSGFGSGSRVTANTLQIGSTSTGPISITGALDLTGANTLDLVSGAAIAETGAGAIAAPVLQASGSAASLNGANAIGTLQNVTIAGNLALTDTAPLVVAGAVQAGTGSTLAALGLDVAGNLTVPGTLSSTGSMSLTASGGVISETGAGQVSAGTLAGSAAAAELGGANTIATLGSFAAGNDLTLNDTAALTVAGPVSATTVTLIDGPGITFTGNLAASTLRLSASNPVVQSAGTLAVGTLTGSAGTLAQFGPDAPGPAAYVGTLGAFSVTNVGTLALADAEPLVIAGPLSAANIAISAPGTVVLSGGSIATDGLPVPQQSAAQPTRPGSYIAVLAGTGGTSQLLQTGTTTITPLDGTTDTVRLDVPASGGSITLDNLSAPTTNLVLATAGGAITGVVDVASLTVLGQTGSAALSGIVNGIGGTAAAPISAIAPGVNVAYTINGCVIMTTCGAGLPVLPPIVTFTTTLPSTLIPGELLLTYLLGGQSEGATPLQVQTLFGGLITIVAPRDYEDPDVLLPNISDRDY